jgi:hypothetical protein
MTMALEGGEGSASCPGCSLPLGKTRYPSQEAGWTPGPVWTGVENLAPTRIRSSDRPVRSESPHRQSYPGPRTALLGSKTNICCVTPDSLNWQYSSNIKGIKNHEAGVTSTGKNVDIHVWKSTNKRCSDWANSMAQLQANTISKQADTVAKHPKTWCCHKGANEYSGNLICRYVHMFRTSLLSTSSWDVYQCFGKHFYLHLQDRKNSLRLRQPSL